MLQMPMKTHYLLPINDDSSHDYWNEDDDDMMMIVMMVYMTMMIIIMIRSDDDDDDNNDKIFEKRQNIYIYILLKQLPFCKKNKPSHEG